MTGTSAVGVSRDVAATARGVFPHVGRPILFVVAEDVLRLEALARDLNRRYGAGYRAVTVSSAGAAVTMLADLADSGAVVALLVADERLMEMPAVDFLARAHEELTNRATQQAWLSGANVVITRAAGLAARVQQRVVRVANGSEVTARAVIIATGAIAVHLLHEYLQAGQE